MIGSVGRLVEIKRHDVLHSARSKKCGVENPPAIIWSSWEMGPCRDETPQLSFGQLDLGPERPSRRLSAPKPGSSCTSWTVSPCRVARRGCLRRSLRPPSPGCRSSRPALVACPKSSSMVGRGSLVEPCEPEAMTQAILSILRDPDTARRMGRAVRERVESRFHVRRMARVYHHHFIEILGSDRPADRPVSNESPL